MAIFAHEQVAGKGQRGKGWMTEKGKNIILSVVIKPDFPVVTGQFPLSACVAVAMHDFFSSYAGNATRIKWPNDLYWQDRKAGGVLIENVIKNNITGNAIWEWAVIGIGININQTSFPEELKNPVSLKQITGKSFNTLELAKELLAKLDSVYHQLTRNGFDTIYAEYLLQLYKKNEPVKLKKDNRVFEALIKTVTPSGQLIIEHAFEETIESGNVEWLNVQ
jgi:BirA family transcriptional regulator, biotin operon repressor / biotin---[acetyl-CoA-carboxylase] ligase